MHLGRAGSASVVVGGLPLRKVTAQPLDLGDGPVAARGAPAASAVEVRERADAMDARFDDASAAVTI